MATPITKTYRVRIDTAGLIGAAPADGFIDHMSIQDYYKNTGNYPTTLANAEAKARANTRYLKMIWFLNETNATTFLYNVDNGGADHDNPGTYFEFTLVYERDDHIYTYNELYGTAHPSGTNKILTLEDAIKRQISRVWIYDFVSNFFWPYDPGSFAGAEWKDVEVTVSSPIPPGTLETRITTAESSITVTQIAGT